MGEAESIGDEPDADEVIADAKADGSQADGSIFGDEIGGTVKAAGVGKGVEHFEQLAGSRVRNDAILVQADGELKCADTLVMGQGPGLVREIKFVGDIPPPFREGNGKRE